MQETECPRQYVLGGRVISLCTGSPAMKCGFFASSTTPWTYPNISRISDQSRPNRLLASPEGNAVN
jgi:hypothetical protein